MTTINVEAGFSIPLQLPEAASTIAIGNQGIIATNTLKPDLLMINGQGTGATSMTVFGRSGKIYEYRIQVGNDVHQLRAMINAVEKGVTVDDLNGIIVLKGMVPNPTSLVRVLTIADRYVSGNAAQPDFSVISDRGGVLTGNTNENQTGIGDELYGVSPDPRLSIPVPPVAGGGVGGGAGGGGGAAAGRAGAGGGGGGGVAGALQQPMMPIKGNIAQNISRGEVVMVAGGKVMSLIKVAKQPKVEIQMQIVAVDRNKTDEFGIDWRLDATSGNKNITIGSLAGGVSQSAVSSGGTSPGSADLFGIITNPGRYTLSTFLKFLQQKGAAKTLSSPLVTAISGESASFLVGGNIPIPVQTQTVNQVTATTATNVRFIQFGLKLIVRPTVLENGKIVITLDQSISEPDYSQAITLLGAQIPGFTQRAVSTITESASGESWAVAGLLSEENSKNLDQIPWLSRVPVIGFLFQKKSEIKTRNELMILVNARVINGDNDTTTSFDNRGDLAPADNTQDEQGDIPAKEESLQMQPEKPEQPVSNTKKRKSTPAAASNRKALISGASQQTNAEDKVRISDRGMMVDEATQQSTGDSPMLAPDAVVEWVSPDNPQSQVLLINATPPLPEELPKVIAAPKVHPAYPGLSSHAKAELLPSTAKQTPTQKIEIETVQEDNLNQQEKKVDNLIKPARSTVVNAISLFNSPIFKMSEPNQFLIKPKPVLGRVYKPITNPSMAINPFSAKL